jgi:hypothetical protein
VDVYVAACREVLVTHIVRGAGGVYCFAEYPFEAKKSYSELLSVVCAGSV